MMINLRGGTAAFQVETGRWRGVAREEAECKECGSGAFLSASVLCQRVLVVHWTNLNPSAFRHGAP